MCFASHEQMRPWPDLVLQGSQHRAKSQHFCLRLLPLESDLRLLQAPRLVISDNNLREELRKINSNSRLSELYLALARDLDVMEAKTPEEVSWEAKLSQGRTWSAVHELQ